MTDAPTHAQVPNDYAGHWNQLEPGSIWPIFDYDEKAYLRVPSFHIWVHRKGDEGEPDMKMDFFCLTKGCAHLDGKDWVMIHNPEFAK